MTTTAFPLAVLFLCYALVGALAVTGLTMLAGA
jgi:hypothetical protein